MNVNPRAPALAPAPSGPRVPAAGPAGNRRNQPLQALRAVAAGAVLLYHAAHYSGLRTGTAWLEQIFGSHFGFFGVLLFFALSGFLMQAAVRRYDPLTFALHRAARLYPTFWLVCTAFFLIQSARFGYWESISWKAWSLLPFGEMARPLAVEWTLVYEVFFYGVCTLLCLRPRLHLPLHLAWLGVIATAFFGFHQFGSTGQPTWTQIAFSALNVPFICGGLAGHLNRLRWQVPPWVLCLAGAAAMMLSPYAPRGADLFVSGPGAACIVLGLARVAVDARRAPAALRWLSALGDRSYGLYLAHCLAIQIALQYVPTTLPPLTVFLAMIGFGIVVGIVVGSVDMALYRTLKRRIDDGRHGSLAANMDAAGR